jgi:hypothetical protein
VGAPSLKNNWVFVTKSEHTWREERFVRRVSYGGRRRFMDWLKILATKYEAHACDKAYAMEVSLPFGHTALPSLFQKCNGSRATFCAPP